MNAAIRRARRAWYLALLAVGGCSPSVPAYCQDDVRCTLRGGGSCLYDHSTGMYCAYSDKDCSSGYRWSPNAARYIADECVDSSVLSGYDLLSR